jgi:hypothetical protein
MDTWLEMKEKVRVRKYWRGLIESLNSANSDKELLYTIQTPLLSSTRGQ